MIALLITILFLVESVQSFCSSRIGHNPVFCKVASVDCRIMSTGVMPFDCSLPKVGYYFKSDSSADPFALPSISSISPNNQATLPAQITLTMNSAVVQPSVPSTFQLRCKNVKVQTFGSCTFDGTGLVSTCDVVHPYRSDCDIILITDHFAEVGALPGMLPVDSDIIGDGGQGTYYLSVGTSTNAQRMDITAVAPSIYASPTSDANKIWGPMTIYGSNFGPPGFLGTPASVQDRFNPFKCDSTSNCCKELYVISNTMMVCTSLDRDTGGTFDVEVKMLPGNWATNPFKSSNYGQVSLDTPTVTSVVWPSAGNRKTGGRGPGSTPFTVTIYGTFLAGSTTRTLPPIIRFGDWPCLGPIQYSHSGSGGLTPAATYLGDATMMTCVMGPGIGAGLTFRFNFKWSTFTGSGSFFEVASPKAVLSSSILLTVNTGTFDFDPPQVLSLTPSTPWKNTQLTINGANFGADRYTYNNFKNAHYLFPDTSFTVTNIHNPSSRANKALPLVVTLGASTCEEVILVSDTRIVCTPPEGQGTDLTVKVTIGGQTNASSLKFSYNVPEVSALFPTALVAGSSLTIYGSSLGSAANPTVTIVNDSAPTSLGACTVTSKGETRVICTIPPGCGTTISVLLTTATPTVAVFAGAKVSYAPPTITSRPGLSISFPTVPTAATPFTLIGTNFPPSTCPFEIQNNINGLVNKCTITTPRTTTEVVCDIAPKGLGSTRSLTLLDGTVAGSITYMDPVVSSLIPASGNPYYAADTPATVTINGNHFGGDDYDPILFVKIGTSACTSRVWVTATQITCTFPKGTGAALPVSVSFTGGNEGSNNIFSYDRPVVNTVVPAVGAITTSGATVTLNGINFGATLGDITVTVGTYPCTPLAGVTDAQVKCTLPAGVGKDLNVVLTANSQASAISVQKYSFPPPEVTAVVATTVPTDTATWTLTVNGSKFGPATTPSKVTFIPPSLAPVSTTSCTASSDTRILCSGVMLPGYGINVDVKVEVGSQESTVLADVITYNRPTTVSFFPTSIDVSTFFTINGANFGPPTPAVDVLGAEIEVSPGVWKFATQVTYISSTRLVVKSPVDPSFGCLHNVRVSVPKVEMSPNTVFAATICYVPPVISSLSVGTSSPHNTLATVLTVFGKNFGDATSNKKHTITIGTIPCAVEDDPPNSWFSDTAVFCVIPNGVGKDLSVIVSVGGQGDTKTLLFTYTAPVITNVLPLVKFSTLGGETVTIRGTDLGYPGLAAGLKADAGGYGSSTSCSCFSTTEIRCQTLAGSGKGLTVTLKSSNYAAVTFANAFSYVEPTLTSVSPNVLDVMDTTTLVTLAGTGFGTILVPVVHTIAASIGGVAMSACTWISDTRATCKHSVAIGANLDVSVTIDTQIGTGTALFTHSIPIVSSITPANYPTATGGTVTIAGKNFGPTSPPGVHTRTVNMGPGVALPCTIVAFVDDTRMVCTVPVGTGKNYAVMVTTSTLINVPTYKFFSYDAPKITSLTQLSTYACESVTPNNVLTINGINFGPTAALTSISATLDTGGMAVSCGSPTWVSDTSITCLVPHHAGKSVTVQVTVSAQADTSSAAVRVTFTAPSVASVTPAVSDCMPGSALMTVVGNNFGPASYEGIADATNQAKVTINGWDCVTTPTLRSNTMIICAIPQGVGIGRSVAVTVGGSASVANSLFSYNPPIVTELASPPAGPKKGLTFITITGKNFGGVVPTSLEVYIAGFKCTTPVRVSDTRITCTTGSAYATPDPKPKALGPNALIVYSDGQNSENADPANPFYTYLEFTSPYCKIDVDNEFPLGKAERERLKEEYFRNIAPLDEENLPNLLTAAGQLARTGASDPGSNGCPTRFVYSSGLEVDHCYIAASPQRDEGANRPQDLVDKDRCCAKINSEPCGLHWVEAPTSVATNMKQVSMTVKKKAYINGILVSFFNPCVNEALPVYNLFNNGAVPGFYQRTTGVSDTPCNVIPGNSGAVSICQDYFKGEILIANAVLKLVFDNKYNVKTNSAGGGGWMMEFEMHGIFENSPYEVRATPVGAISLPCAAATTFSFKATTFAYKAFIPTLPLLLSDTETLNFTAWAQGPDTSLAYVTIVAPPAPAVLDSAGVNTGGIVRNAAGGAYSFSALTLAAPKAGDYKFTFSSPGLKSFVATVTVTVGAPTSIIATRIDSTNFKATDTVRANLVLTMPPFLVRALDPGLNVVIDPLLSYGDITIGCGSSDVPSFMGGCGHTTVTGPTVPMGAGKATFGSDFGTESFINKPHRGTYKISFFSLSYGFAYAPLEVLAGDPAALFIEDPVTNAAGNRDSSVTVEAAQYTAIKRNNGDPITTKLMDAGYHPINSLVQPTLTTSPFREYFVTMVGAGGPGIPAVLTAGTFSPNVTSGLTNQPKYDWFSIVLFEPLVGTYTLQFDSPAPANAPPIIGWMPGQATVLSPAKLTVNVVLGPSVKGLVEMTAPTKIPCLETTSISKVSVFGVDGGNNKAFTAGSSGVYQCNAYLNDTKFSIAGNLTQNTVLASANFTDLTFTVPPKVGFYFVHVKCAAFQPAYPIPFGMIEVVFGTAVALSAENIAEWDVPYRTDFVMPLKTFSVWAVDAGKNKVPTRSGDKITVDTGNNALQVPIEPIALAGGYANFSTITWSNVESGSHAVKFLSTTGLKEGVAQVTVTKGYVGTIGSSTEGKCEWIKDYTTTNKTMWYIGDEVNRANAYCLFVSKRSIKFGAADVLALDSKLQPVSGSSVFDRIVNYQLQYVSIKINSDDKLSPERRVPPGWNSSLPEVGRVAEPQLFSRPPSKMTAGVSTVSDFEIRNPYPGSYRLYIYTDPIGVGGTFYTGYLNIEIVEGPPAALRFQVPPPDEHAPTLTSEVLAQQPVILITDITDNVVKVPSGPGFDVVASVYRISGGQLMNAAIADKTATAAPGTVSAVFTKLSVKGTRGENYTVEFNVVSNFGPFESVSMTMRILNCSESVPNSERISPTSTECHCSPGYFMDPAISSMLDPKACVPCADGTFKNISGSVPCTTCASLNSKNPDTVLNTRTLNLYANTTGNPEALADPFATNVTKEADESALGAKSADRCRCSENFYSFRDTPTICLPCPEGGVCKGGSRIVPASGYWRLNNQTDQFFPCVPPEACPGTTDECKKGYYDNLCSKCQEKYGKVGLECQECPEQKYSWPIFAASILVIVGVIAFLIRSQKNTNWNYTTATVIQKILLNYMQMLSLFGSFAINWPPQVTRMFQISEGTSSFSQNLYTVDCAVKSTYFRKLLVYLLIPILGVIMPLVVFTIWHFVRKAVAFIIRRPYYGTGGDVLNNSLLASMIIIFMTHPTVSRQVFNVFNCRKFEAQEFLAEDLSVDCKSKEYLFWRQVCLIVLFAFCLGVPIYGFILLFFLRKKLTLLKTRSRFGFLYIGLRTKVFYWEMVTILRKLGVVYCVVFVNDNTVHQIFAALWLVQFAILGHLVFKPFEALLAQRLELASLFSGFCTLMVGLMFDDNVGFSDKFKWYLISAIFLANGTTFLMLVTFLIRGKIIMRLTKSEKVIDWRRIAGDVFENEQADASRDLYWLFQDKAMHLQDASLAVQYKEPLQAIITEMVVDPGKSMTPEEVAAIPAPMIDSMLNAMSPQELAALDAISRTLAPNHNRHAEDIGVDDEDGDWDDWDDEEAK